MRKVLIEQLAALKKKRKDENARLTQLSASGTVVDQAEVLACLALDAEVDKLEEQLAALPPDPEPVNVTALQAQAAQNERKLSLDERKVKLLEAKADQADAAKGANGFVDGKPKGTELEKLQAQAAADRKSVV